MFKFDFEHVEVKLPMVIIHPLASHIRLYELMNMMNALTNHGCSFHFLWVSLEHYCAKSFTTFRVLPILSLVIRYTYYMHVDNAECMDTTSTHDAIVHVGHFHFVHVYSNV